MSDENLQDALVRQDPPFEIGTFDIAAGPRGPHDRALIAVAVETGFDAMVDSMVDVHRAEGRLLETDCHEFPSRMTGASARTRRSAAL
jgi:hypothetical protein